jgi:hypothetical protein
VLVVVPTVISIVLFLLVVLALILKHRNGVRKYLLPVTEDPQRTFLQRHLYNLRSWRKPATTAPQHPVETDPRHIPFLVHPPTSHQPQRAYKETWQKFQERQRRRDLDRMTRNQKPKPKVEWLQPRSASYWRNAAKEMEAQRSWWEKLKEKLGM